MIVILVSMVTSDIMDIVEKPVHMELSLMPKLELVMTVNTQFVDVLIPLPTLMIVVKVLSYTF